MAGALSAAKLGSWLAAGAALGAVATGCGTVADASRTGGPRTVPEPLTAPSSVSPRYCLNWLGTEAAIVCNEHLLRESWANHRTTQRWKGVTFATPNNHGRIGTTPGLAQILLENGWPFEPGGSLVIRGRLPKGTIVVVNGRDRSHGQTHWWVGQALFRELSLERGGRAVLKVSVNAEGLVYRLSGPKGTRGPDVVWFKRA
jgi:hypothetical protein